MPPTLINLVISENFAMEQDILNILSIILSSQNSSSHPWFLRRLETFDYVGCPLCAITDLPVALSDSIPNNDIPLRLVKFDLKETRGTCIPKTVISFLKLMERAIIVNVSYEGMDLLSTMSGQGQRIN